MLFLGVSSSSRGSFLDFSMESMVVVPKWLVPWRQPGVWAWRLPSCGGDDQGPDHIFMFLSRTLSINLRPYLQFPLLLGALLKIYIHRFE
jgi:hypothetical protein